jgi:hypothetical protein
MTRDACAPKSLSSRTDFLKDEVFMKSYRPLQMIRKDPDRVLHVLAHHHHSSEHTKVPRSWNVLSGIEANTIASDTNRFTAATLPLARQFTIPSQSYSIIYRKCYRQYDKPPTVKTDSMAGGEDVSMPFAPLPGI